MGVNPALVEAPKFVLSNYDPEYSGFGFVMYLHLHATLEKRFYSEDLILFQHVGDKWAVHDGTLENNCAGLYYTQTHTHAHTFYKAGGTFSSEFIFFSCSLPLLLLLFVVSQKPF